jgi:3-mercaptopyruvate sulfurtransferase SseA
MNRLRLLAQSFCLILIASLLISCGVPSVFVAPTATPTATPEPPKLHSEVPRISPEELKDRLDNGEAILVIDVRSTSEFENWHIAGAISVPGHEVLSRLDEFPRDQELVLYCT